MGCRRGRIERLGRLGWRGLRGSDGLEVDGCRIGVEWRRGNRGRIGIGRRGREGESIAERDAARGSECRCRLEVVVGLERERIER